MSMNRVRKQYFRYFMMWASSKEFITVAGESNCATELGESVAKYS